MMRTVPESSSRDSEDFMLVNAFHHHKVYDDYERMNNAHLADADTSLQAALRHQYPELSLTVTSANNVLLIPFAAAGHATAELDIKDESIQRYRSFLPGSGRLGIPDRLGEFRSFAKYNYRWGDEYFIVYAVQIGFVKLQYILKEPGDEETIMSTNSVTDRLVQTVGRWAYPDDDDKYIYVYDHYWTASSALYKEITKAHWKDVILSEKMKKELTSLMHNFFDSKDIYKDLGVPWKRGVIFHGPAGNGKTISIKALMHTLYERNGYAIPSLYVKSAPYTYDIRSVFVLARRMSPCLLILEDIDTIVTPSSRSYFFNEVDGLENNDGIFMVASTNHLDQLDPGLSSRPSRFDRKYLFPLPDLQERKSYCEYWHEKIKDKPTIKFPEKLCLPIAKITDEFSFAYLKEAFVSTLLAIAGKRSEDEDQDHPEGGEGDGDDLEQYELWREIKKQIESLRKDMGNKQAVASPKPLPPTLIDTADPDLSWKQAVSPFREISPQAHNLATPAARHKVFANERQDLLPRYSDYCLPKESVRDVVQSPIEGAMLDLRFRDRAL